MPFVFDWFIFGMLLYVWALCVCVCVCLCVCVFVCVCVCVCKWMCVCECVKEGGRGMCLCVAIKHAKCFLCRQISNCFPNSIHDDTIVISRMSWWLSQQNEFLLWPGMRVIDNCGSDGTSVAAVSTIFPSLAADSRSCSEQSNMTLGGCFGLMFLWLCISWMCVFFSYYFADNWFRFFS